MGNVPTKERSRSGSTASSASDSIPIYSSRTAGTSPKPKSKAKYGLKSSGTALVLDPTEMVDGGYLAPQGVYSGPQDFKYKVVRQLIIDRRIAPFYKPISDYEDDWTDRQLLAAIRGLPIPIAEVPDPFTKAPNIHAPNSVQSSPIPPNPGSDPSLSEQLSEALESELQQSNPFPHTNSSHGIDIPHNQLQGPGGFHSTALSAPTNQSPQKYSSLVLEALQSPSSDSLGSNLDQHKGAIQRPDRAESISGSIEPGSPSSPVRQSPGINSPQTRSRANTSSRYGQSTIAGRVPSEVALYRDAVECPICFLYYPKYINLTRCCAQPICTECFVQIKRPDPHPPIHSPSPANSPNPDVPSPEADGEEVVASTSDSRSRQSSTSSTTITRNITEPEIDLVSESACCPYCMVPDFGITYAASPFRSGISAEKRHHPLSPLSLFLPSSTNDTSSIASSAISSGSSSSISLVSTSASQGFPAGGKRRSSVPATSSEVVTTDAIRPDWSMKLASARAIAARRSAAATALHASAFLMEDSRREHRSSRKHRHRFKNRSNSSGTTSSLVRISGPSTSSFISTSSGNIIIRPRSNTVGNISINSDSMESPEAAQPNPRESFSSGSTTRNRHPRPDLEQLMVDEAIRLSLLEEEVRKIKLVESAERS